MIVALALDYIVLYINPLVAKTLSLYPPTRTSFRTDVLRPLEVEPAATYPDASNNPGFAGLMSGVRVPCSYDEA